MIFSHIYIRLLYFYLTDSVDNHGEFGYCTELYDYVTAYTPFIRFTEVSMNHTSTTRLAKADTSTRRAAQAPAALAV